MLVPPPHRSVLVVDRLDAGAVKYSVARRYGSRVRLAARRGRNQLHAEVAPDAADSRHMAPRV
jgi:hypothetical protein